jgi:hypothetical protein
VKKKGILGIPFEFFTFLGILAKLPLDISYLYTNFGVNRPKQTQVIELKLNFRAIIRTILVEIAKYLCSRPCGSLQVDFFNLF